MAFKNIKGLTVEIGGDTTKLGKALEDVNKKSRDISSELGEINKLLKMDPGNTDLLTQKQKVLSDAISNTAKKLDTLKAAEKQVQEQFKRGEVSEQQVRELQREIIATEKKMGQYENAAKETQKALKGVGDESEEVTEKSGKLGQALGTAAKVGLQAVAAAATAAIGGLIAAAESTREYRTEMGKLDTAFTSAGHSTEAATATYKALQGVLGETDQAVEAANHLAKLATNEEDLARWTDICTGVYATFGASLPIEGLTEAANETAKTGALTGSLADALNWAGVSEDEFQEKLDKCTTEQERQALITETLNGLYSEAADKYRETNAEVIRANEANEAWTASMAEVGSVIEPIITDVKMMGAALLSDLVPGVKQLAGSFRGLLMDDADVVTYLSDLTGMTEESIAELKALGEEAGYSSAEFQELASVLAEGDDAVQATLTNYLSGAAGIGEALSGIITDLLAKVTELAPTLAQAATSLVTSLTTTVIALLPQLLTTGVEVIMALVQGITQAIPQVVQAIVDMIPQLVAALVDALPQLLDGAVQLFEALVQAVPLIIPPLIDALPEIIVAIIEALVDAIPKLLDASLELFMAVVDSIPEMIKSLKKALPKIWEAMKSFFSTVPAKMWEVLTQAVQKVVQFGSELIAKGKTAAQGLVSAVINGIKGLPSQVLSIGRDLVAGLWNGVNDKLSWLKSKIKSFASSVLDSIKSFFGVRSPSKETAWIGEMLDEGLAQGVEGAAKAPIRAMQRVSSGVLGAAQGGIGFERSLHSTAPASAAASATASGNAALLAKLDGIYERLGRLQMVTDTGALVGEMLDKIDAALGNKQMLAARGVS